MAATDDVPDDPEAAKRLLAALKRKVGRLDDRVADLEAENERLRTRVAKLEGRTQPDPTGKTYDEMDRDERVRKLRVALVRAAQRSNGKAAKDYSDVQSLFGDRPSTGYAYKLMRIAGEAEGFEYDEERGDSKRVLVDLDAVNDESLVHTANNSAGGEDA